MSKFIKFTNDVDSHKGSPLYINSQHITAVYEAPVTEGGSLKTFVFGGSTGIVWEVEESLNTVLKMIEDAQK